MEFLKQDKIWITKERQKIPIKKLENDHLLKIITFLRERSHALHDKECMEFLSLPEPNGDMAQLAVADAIANLTLTAPEDWLEEQPLYISLITEAKRRKLTVPEWRVN
jgi:hypothetical protein